MNYFKLAIVLLLTSSVFGQKQNSSNDSITKLETVVIEIKQQSPERLPEIKDNVLFSGKKNEVLKLSSLNANLSNNNGMFIVI